MNLDPMIIHYPFAHIDKSRYGARECQIHFARQSAFRLNNLRRFNKETFLYEAKYDPALLSVISLTDQEIDGRNDLKTPVNILFELRTGTCSVI